MGSASFPPACLRFTMNEDVMDAGGVADMCDERKKRGGCGGG